MTIRERFKAPLINPTWEQVVEREPLMVFSQYLSGRVNVLLALEDEILGHLDQGFSAASVDGGCVERAESLMWLWMLGAYEVVRTMCQARSCFSNRALDELVQLKKTLSVVRMPAAKMEKAGKKEPVTSNRSPTGWDVANRDLLVNDPEEPSRSLLGQYSRSLTVSSRP